MSRYALVNALNLRVVAVAVILTKAVQRALSALKEFLLPRGENGREDMTLWDLTKAVRGASSGLKVFLLPREENGQEHMALQRSRLFT